MKIEFNKTKWRGQYATPYINVIPYQGGSAGASYLQISFVILNYHFWVIIR